MEMIMRVVFLAVLLACIQVKCIGGENIPGGRFSWVSLQAEDGATNGEVLGPSREAGEFAAECVGRRGVKLCRTGDYVEWTVPKKVNSIVLRYAIPDAPEGGGCEADLSLYIDGVKHSAIALSSHHGWLYGKENRLSNDPKAGKPRHFFDDARLLTGDIPAGAKLRLQKDAGNRAAFYVIDLIDVEDVPPPVPCPAGALTVTSFGAIPDDGGDDSAAIDRALEAALQQKKTLYFPAGTFLTSKKFTLDGQTIQGAGMWYTEIRHHRPAGVTRKGVGFLVNCASNIRDLSIFGAGTFRREESGAIGGICGDGSVFENLWIEHTNTGVWTGKDNTTSPRHVTVRNCRFRNTYADGLNFCNGTSESLAEDCHARGTGDDSFAAWSCKFAEGGPDRGNTFRRCTAEVPRVARCFAVFGGVNMTIEDCVGRDTLVDSGMNISSEFSALTFGGTTTVRNVLLERCGGYFWGGRPYGAIFLHAASRDFAGEFIFDKVRAIDSSCFGITISNGDCTIRNVTFRDCLFSGVTKCGIYVFGNAHGNITLDKCTFELGGLPLVKTLSPDTFTIDFTGSEK